MSPAFERIWRMPVAAVYADWRAWLAHVHEDDRGRVRARMDDLDQTELEIEFRVCPPGHETRYVQMRVYLVRDGAGQLRAARRRDPGRHRAQGTGGAHRAPGVPRLAHRAAQSRDADGSPRPGAVAGAAARPAGGGAVPRPRPLQARQRLAGPPRGRPAAAGDRAPPASSLAARQRHRGARGRRRVPGGGVQRGRADRRRAHRREADARARRAVHARRPGAARHREPGREPVPARRRQRRAAAQVRRHSRSTRPRARAATPTVSSAPR